MRHLCVMPDLQHRPLIRSPRTTLLRLQGDIPTLEETYLSLSK